MPRRGQGCAHAPRRAVPAVGRAFGDRPTRRLAFGIVVSLAGALIVVALVPLAAWRLWAGDVVVLSPASVAGGLYIGVFAGALAFVCRNRGVAAVGATRAGVTVHLMPLFAALLGVTFLGERLAPHHFVGGAQVMIGLVLASTDARSHAPRPPSSQADAPG